MCVLINLQCFCRFFYQCILIIALPFVMCRSALRAFKRRVAYANANYDRILFYIDVGFQIINILFIYKVFSLSFMQDYVLSSLFFKIWLGGELHQSGVNMNFHQRCSLFSFSYLAFLFTFLFGDTFTLIKPDPPYFLLTLWSSPIFS